MTPTDMLNIAETGISSGNAWADKYPNFEPGFISQLDYLTHHSNMRDTIFTQVATNSARSQAVLGLKEANGDITKYGKFVKGYLEELFDDKAKSYYSAYGIVPMGKNYGIPTDNDHRMRSLDTLVAELSKPNNPLKIRKYGLAFWTVLRDKQRFNWTNLKKYDGDRSINSDILKNAKKQALSYQSRLRASIKVYYPLNYKSVQRDFGFQSEKY
jgi:hypothetical protein